MIDKEILNEIMASLIKLANKVDNLENKINALINLQSQPSNLSNTAADFDNKNFSKNSIKKNNAINSIDIRKQIEEERAKHAEKLQNALKTNIPPNNIGLTANHFIDMFKNVETKDEESNK